MVIGTQVAVAVTGTDHFCGTTCHSHEKFVYPEHQLSAHYNNRTGVRAMCVDCHVPHSYPAKLIVKAEKGIADAYAEMRGTISTQEKFDRERWRLANKVWDEMRADNSGELPSLPRPAGHGQRQAVGRRRQAAQEVRLRQGHVHRLPHRRRAQGAGGAAATARTGSARQGPVRRFP